jgi:hypothetical protein
VSSLNNQDKPKKSDEAPVEYKDATWKDVWEVLFPSLTKKKSRPEIKN